MAKIEIACNDLDDEIIVHVISTFGRIGKHWDGIIFVAEVEKVYKMKTCMGKGMD